LNEEDEGSTMVENLPQEGEEERKEDDQGFGSFFLI
jgi:hypothetical protein